MCHVRRIFLALNYSSAMANASDSFRISIQISLKILLHFHQAWESVYLMNPTHSYILWLKFKWHYLGNVGAACSCFLFLELYRRPNEALLSINCFQKDLGDTNPLVRACALRTMAGIRLHVIAPIVLVAVGKCARDPSVYVRKCAASALPKLHDLRIQEHNSTIKEVREILLQCLLVNSFSESVLNYDFPLKRLSSLSYLTFQSFYLHI